MIITLLTIFFSALISGIIFYTIGHKDLNKEKERLEGRIKHTMKMFTDERNKNTLLKSKNIILENKLEVYNHVN